MSKDAAPPHKPKWPPNLDKELSRRIRLVEKLRSSPQFLEVVTAHYLTNPINFINDWAWTHDPRPAGQGGLTTLPFLLFPKQEEFVTWVQGRLAAQDDGLCEKSRELGVTWLCVVIAVWLWLFVPGSSTGFGSRKEQLVDRKGDMDSIFEKIRFVLRYLPKELMPSSFNPRIHQSHMKLINPDNGATVTGEAGDNIGRGGRKSIYFKDESAHYERPMLIEASLSQNTRVQIDVSSVNGAGNPFHEKRMKWQGSDKLFIFDWRDDPRKDQAWYDSQIEKYDPIVVAQEIDRDYAASVEGVVIPGKWVQAAVALNLPGSGQRVGGLDVADEGEDKNALYLRHGHRATYIRQWRDRGATEAGRRGRDTCSDHSIELMRFEKEGVGAAVSGVSREESHRGNPRMQGVSPGSSHLPGWYIKPAKQIKGKKNADMFTNLKAMTWWMVRERFRKTWEVVNQVKTHPQDELISLAGLKGQKDLSFLMSELSQPTYMKTEAGKIKINKKPDGHKSPNLADSLVISYMDRRVITGVW